VEPIPTSIEEIAADELALRRTSADDAWLGAYRTVRLRAAITAVRVHVGAGAAAASVPHLAGGAGIHGRWFAIGDVVQTYDQYRATRALPAHFTEIALARLDVGTVLNVGLCAPLFGLPGGGAQVEYVDGPRPVLRALDARWSRVAGHA
jgi:hypothetical protein